MARTNVTALNIGNVSYFGVEFRPTLIRRPFLQTVLTSLLLPSARRSRNEMRHWAIHIYPNPADQFILINLENQDGSLPLDLKIVDLQGRQVVRTELYDHQTRIAVDHLAPGVFIDRRQIWENTK